MGDDFTVYSSTQIPHILKVQLAIVTGIAEHSLRVSQLAALIAAQEDADPARAALLAYHWLGNVRQLSYVIERAALLSEGSTVSVSALGLPD